MAFNIREDSGPRHSGTTREVARAIFLEHCSPNQTLKPGAAFKGACTSLSREYQSLRALEDVVLEGRAWSLLDRSANGMLSLEDFVEGVENMITPTKDSFKHLAERLKMGNVPDVDSNFAHVRRVAIIGGGVAGLQTARALTRVGKECTIFEKSNNVGGVWRENYADFSLQVPRELYEFPEFPYPEDREWSKFPSGPEVQRYIELYAEHFGLKQFVRFNTAVQEVRPHGDGSRGWRLKFGKEGGPFEEEAFDFVVVATGMYSSPPHIPTVPGKADFKGEIRHSCTFQDAGVAKQKHVVVIGGGKSAIDNACSAAEFGESSTLVYRSPHWPVPRRVLGLLPFQWATYSRAGHFMLPTHHDVGAVEWYLHALLTPLKWAWWRTVELLFRLHFRIPREMLPSTSIEIDLFTGGQIITSEFHDQVRAGKIQAIKGSLQKFTPDGVVLSDGSEHKADLVVFGTGFAKSYDMFDRLLQNKLELQPDGLHLYRNMIPPRLPDFAFIGAEVSTFNNVLTQALQAEWLAKVFKGSVKLPSVQGMLAQLEREQAWKRTWMPATSARAAIYQLHMMKYHDMLMRDLGERVHRKGWNKLAELFAPYRAPDYAGLFAQEATNLGVNTQQGGEARDGIGAGSAGAVATA